jgi:serine/threonine protein phosphatase PrpC
MAVAVSSLTAAARSDAGRVRTNNEDLAVLDAERGVFGVIDGVGGHAAGELAAAIARDVILQRLARPLGTPAERVREAIAIANNEIFRRAHDTPALAGMTCVVTLALVNEGRLTAGHVGDTRLYKLRPHGLRKLTHDHSPVGEREDAQQIDELSAMRHPRRHEVFRDVGSALRDKDEPEYVEVVEDVIEDDAAILVCSDGLTDMIPSAAIEQIVHRHAGDVDAVTTALIAAANEAGGRDNVTVVYAEAPGFASAVRAIAAASAAVSAVVPPGRGGRRWLWFAAGLLIGLLTAAGAAWRLVQEPTVGGRTIAAAPAASETVATLAAALATARAGDVIRLEPGTYGEQVVVPDGVSLRARVPGTAVFTRPGDAAGEWVAITLLGDTGGTLSGIRVTATETAPMQVGIRVYGQGRTIDLLQVEGALVTAVDVAADAAASVHGAHLQASGPAVVVGARGQLELQGSILLRHSALGSRQSEAVATAPGAARPRGRGADRSTPAPPVPAVVLGEGARASVDRSVFVGFGGDPVQGLPETERERLRAANVLITAAPSTVR